MPVAAVLGSSSSSVPGTATPAAAADVTLGKGRELDPFGCGDVPDWHIVNSVMLAMHDQAELQADNSAAQALLHGEAVPETLRRLLLAPDKAEPETIRQLRLRLLERLSEPFVLQDLVATVTASDMPPTSGGYVATESAEDERVLGAGEVMGGPLSDDFDKISFDDDAGWAAALPDPIARAAAQQRVRDFLKEKNQEAVDKYNWPLFGKIPGLFRNLPEELSYFRIPLKPGTVPQRQAQRRYSAFEETEIRAQITKLLEHGIISACFSPWSAGIVLAQKADKTFRFAVDLRKLNAVTEASGHDVFPVRRIESVLQACAGMDWFSALDGRAAFWGVPMHPEDRAKTAFTCPTGQYFFNRMCMGAQSAPAFFQRIAEWLTSPAWQHPGLTTAGGTADEKVLSYLDDLTVCTRGSWETHLDALGRFLDRLAYHGFTLRLDKCVFFRSRIKLLGHVVSRDGISASPDYVQKVSDFQTFRRVKDVQSFLGLAGYYRSYIRNYAARSAPMRACIERCKEDNRQQLGDHWNEACEAARLDLITCLKSAVDGPLAYPNFAVPFRIAVDGCQDPGGVGVTLEQVQPDGKIRPVGYASRALTRTQMKWDVSRIEGWALIFGMRTFRWALNPTCLTCW